VENDDPKSAAFDDIKIQLPTTWAKTPGFEYFLVSGAVCCATTKASAIPSGAPRAMESAQNGFPLLFFSCWQSRQLSSLSPPLPPQASGMGKPLFNGKDLNRLENHVGPGKHEPWKTGPYFRTQRRNGACLLLEPGASFPIAAFRVRLTRCATLNETNLRSLHSYPPLEPREEWECPFTTAYEVQIDNHPPETFPTKTNILHYPAHFIIIISLTKPLAKTRQARARVGIPWSSRSTVRAPPLCSTMSPSPTTPKANPYPGGAKFNFEPQAMGGFAPNGGYNRPAESTATTILWFFQKRSSVQAAESNFEFSRFLIQSSGLDGFLF